MQSLRAIRDIHMAGIDETNFHEVCAPYNFKVLPVYYRIVGKHILPLKFSEQNVTEKYVIFS